MKVPTQGQSRFLSREDLPVPVIAAMDNIVSDPTLRNPWVLQFIDDVLKPLPLNVTNRRIIVAAYGDDSDAWQGLLIEVYFDPSVPNPRDPSRPGGVKVRIPAPPPPPARPAPAPAVNRTAPKPAAVPGRADPATATAAATKPAGNRTSPGRKVHNISEKHAGVLRGYANAKTEAMIEEVAAWADKQDFATHHHEEQADAYNAALDRLGVVSAAVHGNIPF